MATLSNIVAQERVRQRTVEQMVEIPVPQVVEEVEQVSKIAPQERVMQHSVEQIVEVPVPQVVEEIVQVRATNVAEVGR